MALEGDTVQLRQWGGYGGKPWAWTGLIQEIIVFHGAAVRSLTFTTIKDGKTETSPKFGGDGQEESGKVSLGNGEYLVKIEGTLGVLRDYIPDQQLITSLTFVSNKQPFGPYGSKGSTKFSLPLEEGSRIAGFFGRCGQYLDSIGVNVVGSAMEGKVKVGLSGESIERFWQYDGPIKKIKLKYKDVIESIRFGSTKFGGNGGRKTEEVSLTLTQDEYLISIRGTTGNIDGNSVISSLVFLSNKCSYGPYGLQRATGHFYCPVQSGKIIGFYGGSRHQLEAIGITMAPLPLTLPYIPSSIVHTH